MLKAERLQKIIDQIAKENKAVLEELGKLLNVSTDTIRRDIKELSDKGLLQAVRGGAVSRSPLYPDYKEREHIDIGYKNIIAQKALEFIMPGQVIFVDAGTTAVSVMKALPQHIRLTVITNSFPVISIVEDYPNIETFFIGGRLNKSSFSTEGSEVIETIRNFRVDLCLLGICSIDLKAGITGADYEESLIKKALAETSKYIVALSTYDKIGRTDPYYICATNAIDAFITEKDPSESDLADFKNAGIKIK
jgi:DeoR/GlpR family transcriptional regulator of sugar metabolism